MFKSLHLKCFLIALFLTLQLLTKIAAAENVENKPVTEDCLECICEAKSGCNDTAICVNGACGIFRITWGYWVEAGQLTLPNDTSLSEQAFTNCVNEPRCAADTVQHYMSKYGQDCNNDERIDCLDYGNLHKLGYLNCRADLPYSFGKPFHSCLRNKQRLYKKLTTT